MRERRRHHRRVVVAVNDVHFRRERRAVTKIGGERLCGFSRAVDQHDLARAAAVDRRPGAGAVNAAGSDKC